jgi:hypothetical protein
VAIVHMNLSSYQDSGFNITLALWLVAAFEALFYQAMPNFNKSDNLEIGTETAINYSACYAFAFYLLALKAFKISYKF